MQDALVIVTGATDGIGFVTAEELAAQGAQVVIVGRNEAKCADTVAMIKNTTGNQNIGLEVADLSLLAEVRSLAARLLEYPIPIDVLINNAGGFYSNRSETAEGLEYTFALNHMAYFVLTDLLLERVQEASQGRIINVSSRVHRAGRVDFDDLQGRNNYQGWPAYCQSKLMNVMFTKALARRLEGTAVTANSLHPGFVATKFGHNNPGYRGMLMRIGQTVAAISPRRGAKTSVHLASDPNLAKTTGRYFEKSREVTPSRESQDEAAQERLWQVSEDLAVSIS